MRFTELPHKALTASIAFAVATCAITVPGCGASKNEGADVAAQQEQQNAIVEQEQSANDANGVNSTPETREAKPEHRKVVTTLSKEMAAAKSDVDELVKPYGQKARIYVERLDSEESFGVNAKAKTAAASLIKLAVLAEVMAEVDAGKLTWSESVGSAGSSVEQLARKMITESDNSAANKLIDLVGMSAVNKRCKKLGLDSTKLNRKMLATGKENTTSAYDVARILRGIADGTLADKASCKKAEGFLKDQVRRYGIPSGISEDIKVGNKTGELNSVGYDSKIDVSGGSVPVRHDAAIVYADKPFVVVIMTVGIEEDEAHELMGDIAAVLESDLS